MKSPLVFFSMYIGVFVLLITPICAIGDVNNDGVVNSADLLAVLGDFGRTSGFNPAHDLNSDNIINLYDLVVVGQNWGTTSSGTTGLSGTVTNTSGSTVSGGVVQVFSGNTIVANLTVGASGTYSTTSLGAGTYTLKLQPNVNYSLGVTEPDNKTATITSGATTSVDFTVQPAHYFDNFQAYTTAQLWAGATQNPIPSNGFWAGANHDLGGLSQHPNVTMDLNEGGLGYRAMRYDWPAKPTTACNIEQTIAMMPRWINPPANTTNLWVRFTSKESPNFEHGRTGCGGRSYKFFLIPINTGSTQGRFGTYLFDGPGFTPVSTRFFMDQVDSMGNVLQQGGQNIGGDVSWGGAYHTWVIEILGMGTSNTSFTVYLDGNRVDTINLPFLPGQSIGPGWAIQLEMGANINNGPDNPQSRWFRELGVYTTRPSLLPMQ
jgi:hypothetical protein